MSMDSRTWIIQSYAQLAEETNTFTVLNHKEPVTVLIAILSQGFSALAFEAI